MKILSAILMCIVWLLISVGAQADCAWSVQSHEPTGDGVDQYSRCQEGNTGIATRVIHFKFNEAATCDILYVKPGFIQTDSSCIATSFVSDGSTCGANSGVIYGTFTVGSWLPPAPYSSAVTFCGACGVTQKTINSFYQGATIQYICGN